MNVFLKSVIEKYSQGDIKGVGQQLYPYPGFSYDIHNDQDPLLHFLINYFDASFFTGLSQAFHAIHSLLSYCSKNSPTDHAQLITRLQFELKLLYVAITSKKDYPLPPPFDLIFDSAKQGNLIELAQWTYLMSQAPEGYRLLCQEQLQITQQWLRFKAKNKALATLLDEQLPLQQPWHLLKFDLKTSSKLTSNSNIPVIFLEPFNIDYSAFLKTLPGPKIFAFERLTSLRHMLQFPEVLEALCDPENLIYVLEAYPNSQFALQDLSPFKHGTLEAITFSEKKSLNRHLPLFIEALTACLTQEDTAFKKDTEQGTRLYRLCQKLQLSDDEKRLGPSRIFALYEYNVGNLWNDKHKGISTIDNELKPSGTDFLSDRLAEMHTIASNKKPKLKLVHVTPQIVDGGHAPSKLLESLIDFHDHEKFSLMIISTERLQNHPLEYPLSSNPSESTAKRAKERLAHFRSKNIPYFIIEDAGSYEISAQRITALLDQMEPDIIVFHGPDSINYQCANLTPKGLKVLFEHGTPPSYPGFDLVITSSHEALKIYQDLFKKIGCQAEAIPFNIDVRKGWLPDAYPKKLFGLPEDSQVMTTISNNLDSRLSHEMCLAIAAILKRIPNAHYAPMGHVIDKTKFLDFFKQQGVESRIHFLGSKSLPSQCARSMNLYLNEFPFGSGLGILDAMAAGCPVVSMYDIKGPPQARFGGVYFGIERTISSGKTEEYVELACRLLTDPKMYHEWSDHAKKCYEKHADVKGYVKTFEDTIVKHLK